MRDAQLSPKRGIVASMRSSLPLLLSIACTTTPKPVDAPASGEPSDSAGPPAADDSAAADSGGEPDSGEPVVYSDPIVRGSTMDLAVPGPELTDAVMAGDLLLYAGQEQRGDGGVWAFDVSTPDAPALTGKTSIWHIQRICWSGTVAYGLTREAELQRIELHDRMPVLTDRFPMGGWGGGLDCDGDRVAVALKEGGVRVARITGSAPAEVEVLARLETPAMDVLWEDDRLWVLAENQLTVWQVDDTGAEPLGSVALAGTCRDLAAGEDWLAVACGAGGVALVGRGDGTPDLLSQWTGGLSARTVAVQDDHVWVAAWTDLALLDASDPTQPILRGTEPAGSAVMGVVADGDDRAWVADWSQPFGVTWSREDAPEVRLNTAVALPGDTVTVVNDGLADLHIEALDGAVDQDVVAPGGFAFWTLPGEGSELATLHTNDPDEPSVAVGLSAAEGMQPGAEAPRFIETDVDGTTWDLDALAGKVVFVGMFQDGCPTCESEVPDTDTLLTAEYAEEAGLVMLWSFGGPTGRARDWQREAGIALPILVDEDDSMRRDYFIENGEDAFAANPRHYVIGRDGRFVAVLTAPSPGALREALDTALAE